MRRAMPRVVILLTIFLMGLIAGKTYARRPETRGFYRIQGAYARIHEIPREEGAALILLAGIALLLIFGVALIARGLKSASPPATPRGHSPDRPRDGQLAVGE